MTATTSVTSTQDREPHLPVQPHWLQLTAGPTTARAPFTFTAIVNPRIALIAPEQKYRGRTTCGLVVRRWRPSPHHQGPVDGYHLHRNLPAGEVGRRATAVFRLLAEAAGCSGEILAYCQGTQPGKAEPTDKKQQTPVPDDPGQGQGPGGSNGTGVGTGTGNQGQGGPPSTRRPR